jgi:lipopolysaccharide assembly protein B
MSLILLLLLPIAAFFKLTKKSVPSHSKSKSVPEDYLVGIHLLLAEQPDKAVDVFIKMLEVNNNTVETHLALGSLFRRRGEVDRAIRVHQNLIARPNLSTEQRVEALLALGQDYLRAGMLDRAERIFLEVVSTNLYVSAALRFLKEIYQREKAWEDAIQIAIKLQLASGEDQQPTIAHYYCELSLKYKTTQPQKSENYLYQALQTDKKNVRASLLLGELAIEMQDYKTAIKHFQQVRFQDPDYLSEALQPLAKCYEQMGLNSEFIRFLKDCLKEHARISLVLILSDYVIQQYGAAAAVELITDYLRLHPSVRGLKRLIELQIAAIPKDTTQDLPILRDITSRMLENKPVYRCDECGFGAKTLHWLCPGCRNWNSVKPIHGLEGD